VATPEQMASTEFWRAQRLEAALVYTWMGGSRETVDALVGAGVRVVSKGDTDGQLGIRVHPVACFRRMVYSQISPLEKIRAAWFWLKKYLWLHRAEDRRVLENLERSGSTIVETPSARAGIARFLSAYGREDLLAKIHLIGNPVSIDLVESAVPDKQRKVVAVGRWDDPVKDERLLAAALKRFLHGGREVEVVVLGGGASHWLSVLEGHPRVRLMGAVPHAEIVAHLADAQVCLVTSHWEGCMMAAHEMLAMGGTLAGARIPLLADLSDFATLAHSRRPEEVAVALDTELDAWRKRRRQADQIAAHWRPRLHPHGVARRVAELMGLS